MPVDPLPVFLRSVETELRAMVRALEALLVKLDDWRADAGVRNEEGPPSGGPSVRPYPDEEARTPRESIEPTRTWLCPRGCELPRLPDEGERRLACGAPLGAIPATCIYRREVP